MSPRRGGRLPTMDTTNLAGLYDLPTMEWAAVVAGLDAGFPQAPGQGGPNRHTCWLTTLNADGGPHVTAVGALWADGAFWFQTGAGTRKGRNLARDPRCAISLAADDFDVTVEGRAERVTDPATVARIAARYAEGGWPCRVDDSGTALTAEFSAPSAGRPPWSVYRLDAAAATALGTVEPGGATRWTF
jgi:PPOX class probable F420-dependent enzyme